MDFELISEEEYENLPADDDRCFVEFERICRRHMTRMINDNTTSDFDQSVREQYIAAVAAVAIECHTPNVVYHNAVRERDFWQEFSSFSLSVQGEVARIRIRQRGEHNPYSVLLTDSTRTKIEHYISRIRDMVDRSEMDPDRKKKLNDKLRDLTRELDSQRVSFAKTMSILVALSTTIAGVGGMTTIAAEGPSAIAHIMALIGADKQSEDDAAKRLAPPPKALPAPEKRSTARLITPRQAAQLDLEDDIPF